MRTLRFDGCMGRVKNVKFLRFSYIKVVLIKLGLFPSKFINDFGMRRAKTKENKTDTHSKNHLYRMFHARNFSQLPCISDMIVVVILTLILILAVTLSIRPIFERFNSLDFSIRIRNHSGWFRRCNKCCYFHE